MTPTVNDTVRPHAVASASHGNRRQQCRPGGI